MIVSTETRSSSTEAMTRAKFWSLFLKLRLRLLDFERDNLALSEAALDFERDNLASTKVRPGLRSKLPSYCSCLFFL